MAFTENKSGSLVYMTAPNISAAHAFTTRYGGVSRGIFSSLNLAANRGDEPEHIRENYDILSRALGINTGDIVFSRQVHKADIRIVTSDDRHELFTDVPYEADGLVTSVSGIPLIIFTDRKSVV